MNLDVPLDELVSLAKHSSKAAAGGRIDRRGERGRGSARALGRGAGRGIGGRNAMAPAPVSLPRRRPSPVDGLAAASFLRPRRPSTASHIAKSFIARRSEGWQRSLFQYAVGSALGIDTDAKLFISNLEIGVSNEDIKELFSELGTLKHCGVHYDRSGRSMGTADVVYLRKEDAIAAISRYNNVQLDGKPMKIDLVGTSVITSPGSAAYGFGRGRSSLPMRADAYGQGSGFKRFQSQGRGSGRGKSIGSGNGSGRGRGRGRGRGSGRVTARGSDKRPFKKVKKTLTAEDLDADLEKYHKEAMQTS